MECKLFRCLEVICISFVVIVKNIYLLVTLYLHHEEVDWFLPLLVSVAMATQQGGSSDRNGSKMSQGRQSCMTHSQMFNKFDVMTLATDTSAFICTCVCSLL